MSKLYDYVRHPRASELGARGPTKTSDFRRTNHPNFFVRLNARFGLKITLVVGTMWCAYAFTIIALFALPSAIKQGTYFVVVWLSSSFLQLVLLPIIIVGQNIQAAAADKRSEDTYKDAEAVLKESEEIQKHLLAQDEAISSILERLERLMGEHTTPSPGPTTA
jgi:type VI protein secretion system component VasK